MRTVPDVSLDPSQPWQILTGEYPPRPGGVSDYTALVASGLAKAGSEVHVWTASGRADSGEAGRGEPGVTVHDLPGGWSRAGLADLGRRLDAFPSPRRILLQYAPNVFARKGLNFPLGRWLVDRRRRGDQIRVMFHEVTYVVKPGDSTARRVLAMGQRRIAANLLRAAQRVDVTIPYWESMLRPLDPDRGRDYAWRPVPSNIPRVTDPRGVAQVRSDWIGSTGAAQLVGHFGTFAPDLVETLRPTIVGLLDARADTVAVLLGRGGDREAAAWLAARPDLAGRILATGGLPAADLSRALQATDLLIQPFPGGACSKRTSLMAGISHGIPTVSNEGEATEPLWRGVIGLAPEGDISALVGEGCRLLASGPDLLTLGRAGRDLYERRFAIERTIEGLRDDQARAGASAR